MRLRTVLLAVASAFALTLSVSTSAHAEASGSFTYYFVIPENGVQDNGVLEEPYLNECFKIPVGSDPEATAYSPQNSTDAYADVYTESDCEGTPVTLEPSSDLRGDLSGLKSVKFRAAS
ncbi:hypothetical protein [Streptomyces abikoensis]